MPRNHVSLAGFCDWNEDTSQDNFSVSKLYRELAHTKQMLPQSHFNSYSNTTNGMASINNKLFNSIPTSASGSHHLPANPGRMFLRDKKALTRGEREIIEGIYKNRSQFKVKEPNNHNNISFDFEVKSHKEAWQTGTYLMKNESLNGKKLNTANSKQHQNSVQCQHCPRRTTPKTAPLSRSNDSFEEQILTPKSNKDDLKSRQVLAIDTCNFCTPERYHIPRIQTSSSTKPRILLERDQFWSSPPIAPPSTPIDTHPKDEKLFDIPATTSLSQFLPVYRTGDADISEMQKHESTTQSSKKSSVSNRSPREVVKIKKTINMIQTVLGENTETKSCQNQKQISSSSGFYSEDHDSTLCDSSSGSDIDSKKVKVKVYLPREHCVRMTEEEDDGGISSDDDTEPCLVTSSIDTQRASSHRDIEEDIDSYEQE